MSVIVPVRNRQDLLATLFAGLDEQSFRDFEVIVVDDGSTDGAAELAERTVVAGRPVRVLRQQQLGAVAARMAGVREAKGPILAFTDSDCRPDPGWLTAIVESIADGADLVHGLTIASRRPHPLERTTEGGWEGLFPTCNIAVTRSAYDAVGGFDGTAGDRWGFRHDEHAKGMGFGEDTLFGWRAVRAGQDVRYNGEALVRHHVFPMDLKDTFSRAWMMAAFPALVREVPELRSTLVQHGVVWAGRSRLPVYAVAASAIARRPGLAALATGWWVGLRASELLAAPGSRRRNLRLLGVEMAVDAVTSTALLVGSVRARLLLV